MTVRVYAPVMPSVEVFGAYEGVATATAVNQKVSLTFTPTTGNLTIVPYGTAGGVSQLQLEAGSVPSSYIPTLDATATRGTDGPLTVAGADMPWSGTAVSIAVKGRMTYADLNAYSTVRHVNWSAIGNNSLQIKLDTFGASTGSPIQVHLYAGVASYSYPSQSYSPGIDVLFSMAGRWTSAQINLASLGDVASAVTVSGLPALSATPFHIGYVFMGTIESVRVWSDDIGNTGIASAST